MYPDKILRANTVEIKSVNAKLETDVGELKATLTKEKNHAAGLAAVQIGLNRRFFGLIMGEKRELSVYINPRIEKTFGQKSRPIMTYDDGGKEDFLEGCLSFPGLFGTVKRYLQIEAVWDEIRDGKLISNNRIMEGLEAIAYQHELDHLNGVLFIDHILEEGGELYEWANNRKKKVDINRVVEEEKVYEKK
jgi:peptide deformylase